MEISSVYLRISKLPLREEGGTKVDATFVTTTRINSQAYKSRVGFLMEIQLMGL